MDELIKQTVSLISDYHNDDGLTIDEAHVKRWIKQFDSNDRTFLLTEINHILPDSYISKKFFIKRIIKILEKLTEHYEFKSVKKFLTQTKFLQCQKETKSQSILLNHIDEVLKKEYLISLDDCGTENEKYWLYLDDILASGGTFRRDLEKVITDYGTDKFMKSEIHIINVFFFLHTWGYNNAKYALSKTIDDKIGKKMTFFRFMEIDNNPRINYYNPNPKLNHAFPIDCNDERVSEYLDNLDAENNFNFAFRKADKPIKEEFYSSPENRNRYEQILLTKGLDLIDQIHKKPAISLRPLGMITPSYKTLGLGSHAFTWRNISNTCPLVFWWETNGWQPLFPVVNRGGH